MRCWLSTLEYDPFAPVEIWALDEFSDMGETSRRVNRIRTLDAGVVTNDFGHSYGDRTVKLVWESGSLGYEDSIARLVRSYARLTLSFYDGLFEVAPQAYSSNGTQSKITLLIISKLSE